MEISRANEKLLTAEEVAERLNVPLSWVYLQARNRAIPSIRLGRHVRFDWPAISRWLDSRQSWPRDM